MALRTAFFNVTIATGATPTVTILKMPLPFVQVSPSSWCENVWVWACEDVWVCRCVGMWTYVRVFFSIHCSTFSSSLLSFHSPSLLTRPPLSHIQTSLSIPTLYVWRMEITLLVELRSTTMACGAPSVTTTGLWQKLVSSAGSWVSLGRWLLSAMERKRLFHFNPENTPQWLLKERGGHIFKSSMIFHCAIVSFVRL